jgi:hypothetical protein
MAHGTPLGKAENDERYGKEGPFLIEAGISSSHHIANFFGLTHGIPKLAKATSPVIAESPSAKLIPLASPISALAPDLSKILEPLLTAKETPKSKESPKAKPKEKAKAKAKSTAKAKEKQKEKPKRNRVLDVGAVITRALTAAGLMK